MAEESQEGRPLLEPLQHGHRVGRRPSQNPVVIECNKLYGFETSDAALERTDWKFPSSESLRIIPVDLENYRKFITNFQDQDGSGYYHHQQDRTYLKLLYVPWKKELLNKGSFEDTKLPIEAETRKLAQEQRWITDEYRHLWHNNSGGSAVLTEVEKSGLLLQTPNDDEPFCSLSISEFQPTGNKAPSCGGMYVADDEYSLKNLLGSTSIQDYCASGNDGTISKFHVLSMLLPVRILQKHTAATRKRLVDLAKELTLVEERIARLSEDIALGKMMQSTEKDNKLLNEMNLKHMKYHRRWNFERELGASILRYFDTVAARDNGKLKHNLQAKAMRDQVERQIRSSESLKYDFDTIPRRIRNQSKAIFNLMIQRDNQLNLSIAEHSRHLNKINTDIAKSSQQIAVESRRDSASMKTIAVLTLVFLPGTFVASFFSMQMFNWEAGRGEQVVSKYFWIYWAITIPLTSFVLLGWLVFYCFWQKPRTKDVEGIEPGLPPLPPKRTDLPFKYEKFS